MNAPLRKHELSDALPVEPSGRMEGFTVRVLNADDGNAFRALRLEALKNEGYLFGPTYEKENAITDSDWWRNRCSETKDSCFVGLFDRDNLIGIMGAKTWDRDQSGETALWWSAFIRTEYRGQGLGADLYQAREAWTVAHHFKRAVFFILEGNQRSTAIHEKNGARHTSTEIMDWPERPKAPWRWYEKRMPVSETG